VRDYYMQVALSIHRCPECGGKLKMTGQSECSCSCGKTFDPTVAFQKSSCCEARLVRRTFHYACSACGETVPSRFLFDERIFDKAYFKEMMRECRRRAKEKKEEIRRLVADSRSETLALTEDPRLDTIPGLIQDLNDFIQNGRLELGADAFDAAPAFSMEDYREHILSALTWDAVLFSGIDPVIGDLRLDKIWRFITLVYMQHDHEVNLSQSGNDLLVQRTHDEAYSQRQGISGAPEDTF
jgi:hypothetical protein